MTSSTQAAATTDQPSDGWVPSCPSHRPLAAERRAYLLCRLDTSGTVRTRALAAELGVAEMTVARDLRNLADAGLCRRVYGGAMSLRMPAPSDPRRVRLDDGASAVAAKAVGLIGSGSRVVLDGAQIMVSVAQALPGDLPCTVVTRSPAVAHALSTHRLVVVHLVGGPVSSVTGQSGDAAAVERVMTEPADLLLLEVDGVHPLRGLTAVDGEDAAIKRLLVSRSARTYVVMPGSQFGMAADHPVARLAGVAGLVTDELLPGARRIAQDQRIRIV